MQIRIWIFFLLFFSILSCDNKPHFYNDSTPVSVITINKILPYLKKETYSGVIVPRSEATLSFRVAGRITERFVDVGDYIKEGKIIAALDKVPYELSLEDAKAKLTQAEVNLARVTRDVQRNYHLVKKGATSKIEFDRIFAEKQHAIAQVATSKSYFELMKNDLSYADLKTTKNGVITNVYVQVGEVVQVGVPIIAVAYDEKKEVQLDIPETSIADMQLNMLAQVYLLSNPTKKIKGHIREISPIADPITRTYRVRIVLEDYPENIKLGMTVNVSFLIQKKDSQIKLPLTALIENQQGFAVWILKKDSDYPELRNVKILEYKTDFFTVSEGINIGDQVVVSGAHRLDKNKKVHVWDNLLP